MMPANLLPLVSFVLITTFTPGPSNISSASMGVLHGYKKTLNYLVGLAAGFFCVMLLSGWISTTLLSLFPALEPALDPRQEGRERLDLAPAHRLERPAGIVRVLGRQGGRNQQDEKGVEGQAHAPSYSAQLTGG